MAKRGTHPNSLANIIPHQRKKGDPPLEGAGRPRRPLTDPMSDLLTKKFPLTPKNRQVLQRLGLDVKEGPNGEVIQLNNHEMNYTFGEIAIAAKVLRMIVDESSFQDGRNAIEGSPVARQIVEQHDSGNLILHSKIEPAPPGFENEPGPFARQSPLAADTTQVDAKPADAKA